jgi:hypothetical protein
MSLYEAVRRAKAETNHEGGNVVCAFEVRY